MDMLGEPQKLADAEGYGPIFDLVKSHVEEVLSLHRAGLTLALSDLPSYVGAYHVLGSNYLVINRRLLQRVRAEEPKEIVNSFLYMLMLHEYLHSLGLTEEGKVRQASKEVASRMLGVGHPATMLVTNPLNKLFPYIEALGETKKEGPFEVIHEFDRKSYPYIS